MLLQYLSDSPVAPLQARLVEVPDPFCSAISESVYENSETCIGFTFSGVPTEQLSLLEEKLATFSLTMCTIQLYITFLQYSYAVYIRVL